MFTQVVTQRLFGQEASFQKDRSRILVKRPQFETIDLQVAHKTLQASQLNRSRLAVAVSREIVWNNENLHNPLIMVNQMRQVLQTLPQLATSAAASTNQPKSTLKTNELMQLRQEIIDQIQLLKTPFHMISVTELPFFVPQRLQTLNTIDMNYYNYFIQQNEQLSRQKNFQQRQFLQNTFKFTVFGLIGGGVLLLTGSMILTPLATKQFLDAFSPPIVSDWLKNNYGSIAWQVFGYGPSFLSGGMPLILAEVLKTNPNVHLAILQTSKLALGFVNTSPIVATIAGEVALSTLTKLASQTVNFLLNTKTDEQLYYMALEESAAVKLQQDVEFDKLRQRFLNGETLQQFEANFKKEQTLESDSFLHRLRSLSHNAWERIKVRKKGIVLAIMAGGSLYMAGLLGPIMNAVKRLGVGKYLKRVVYGLVVGTMTTIVTSPVVLNRLFEKLIWPLIVKYILIEKIIAPMYTNIMLPRISNAKIGELPILNWLKRMIGSYYETELKWDVTVNDVAQYLFNSISVVTCNQMMRQYINPGQIGALMNSITPGALGLMFARSKNVFQDLIAHETVTGLTIGEKVEYVTKHFLEVEQLISPGQTLINRQGNASYIVNELDLASMDLTVDNQATRKGETINLLSNPEFFTQNWIQKHDPETKRDYGVRVDLAPYMWNIIRAQAQLARGESDIVSADLLQQVIQKGEDPKKIQDLLVKISINHKRLNMIEKALALSQAELQEKKGQLDRSYLLETTKIQNLKQLMDDQQWLTIAKDADLRQSIESTILTKSTDETDKNLFSRFLETNTKINDNIYCKYVEGTMSKIITNLKIFNACTRDKTNLSELISRISSASQQFYDGFEGRVGKVTREWNDLQTKIETMKQEIQTLRMEFQTQVDTNIRQLEDFVKNGTLYRGVPIELISSSRVEQLANQIQIAQVETKNYSPFAMVVEQKPTVLEQQEQKQQQKQTQQLKQTMKQQKIQQIQQVQTVQRMQVLQRVQNEFQSILTFTQNFKLSQLTASLLDFRNLFSTMSVSSLQISDDLYSQLNESLSRYEKQLDNIKNELEKLGSTNLLKCLQANYSLDFATGKANPEEFSNCYYMAHIGTLIYSRQASKSLYPPLLKFLGPLGASISAILFAIEQTLMGVLYVAPQISVMDRANEIINAPRTEEEPLKKATPEELETQESALFITMLQTVSCVTNRAFLPGSFCQEGLQAKFSVRDILMSIPGELISENEDLRQFIVDLSSNNVGVSSIIHLVKASFALGEVANNILKTILFGSLESSSLRQIVDHLIDVWTQQETNSILSANINAIYRTNVNYFSVFMRILSNPDLHGAFLLGLTGLL